MGAEKPVKFIFVYLKTGFAHLAISSVPLPIDQKPVGHVCLF